MRVQDAVDAVVRMVEHPDKSSGHAQSAYKSSTRARQKQPNTLAQNLGARPPPSS